MSIAKYWKRLSPRQRGRIACTAVAVAGAVTVAGCGGASSAATGSSSGSAYRVGASMILSGPAAAYGANMTGGMQAYFKYVNAHGGINGKQIQLDTADGGLVASSTIQSIKTLAEQDNDVVIGGLLASSGVQGAHDIIQAAKVTVLEGSPVLPDVRPQASPYFYGGGGPVYPDDAYIQANFAKQQVIDGSNAHPRIGLIYEISSETVAYGNEIKQLAAQNGWDLVDTEAYQVGTTSFASQAARMAAAKPDYIFASFDESNFAFIKALQAAGVKAPIIANQGGPTAQQLAQLKYPGLYVERAYVYPVGNSPVVKQYLARVAQYGGGADPTNHITQYGYLQAQIIVAVLRKCGADCTAATFTSTISQIHSIPTGGFTFGPVTYSTANEAGLPTSAVYTYDTTTDQLVLLPHLYTWPQS
jgi:branched-chain amino acid transport system substrate-binding protein